MLLAFLSVQFAFRASIVVSAYPLVDTLIVLKVITEYKIAYKRFLKRVAKECVEMMGGHTPRNPPSTTSLALARI
uniref:Secreted protein n=1 Tax=Caenorhabditis tropicalis TaxID=1561998 RepID=A0A1I7U859_9PELO